MAWEVLSIIGTVAFAISGAIVAMEEEYDICALTGASETKKRS